MRLTELLMVGCLLNVPAASSLAWGGPRLPVTETDTIQLPSPHQEGGMPLLDALRQRRSWRKFNSREIPLDVLSDLLWSAFGINRPESGKRTAPSPHNRKNIDIYVATPAGVYLYLPVPHSLKLLLAEDIRKDTGTQEYVAHAQLNLVYVADFALAEGRPEDETLFFAAATAGFIGQNVYLFCASRGLGAVIRADIDRESLAAKLKLRPDQRIILGQSVGYPSD
jgi:nitroreductase